jgi:predicted DNA repair protein MutK
MGSPDGQTERYRFLLRMPQQLRVELVDSASRTDSSLNSEIVARLERSLTDERRVAARAATLLRARRAIVAAATTGIAAVVAALALAGESDTRSPARMQSDAAQLGAKLARTTPVAVAPRR